jgi:hypothetical protein
MVLVFNTFMSKSKELLDLCLENKMFKDYNNYEKMLSKYLSQDDIDKNKSFIKKSFDLDVSITQLVKDLRRNKK